MTKTKFKNTALAPAPNTVQGRGQGVKLNIRRFNSTYTNSDTDLSNFFAWLVGFCDAEGNFQTTKFKRINKNGIVTSIGLKYSFHIGLHLRDKDLLELIQYKLNNIGKIYEYVNKEEAHLAVFKIEELKWLIENIFSKYPLLSPWPRPWTRIGAGARAKNQRLRYEQMKIGIINNYKRLNNLEDFQTILIDPHSLTNLNDLNLKKDFLENWTCGFLNGEVSFTNTIKNNKKNPKINLEHTDEESIELIKNILELKLKTYIRTRGQRKTTYSISINSKNDIKNTVMFLNKLNNIKGYKLVQYNNWKLEYNL